MAVQQSFMWPSDFLASVLTMAPPSLLLLMKRSSHDDARMREIKQKMRTVGQGLEEMYAFVDGQPHERQERARTALRNAFEAGCTFSELNLLPPQPPIGPDGQMKLGAALKEHVLRAREVYAQMNQLRIVISNLLDEDSEELLGLLRHDDTTTETSSTALAA